MKQFMHRVSNFQTVVLAIVVGTLAIVSCGSIENLSYDTDPNALLVQAQTIYPPLPPMMQCYLLPDLRVWGDGRVVRVMTKGDKREIAVGQLSANRVVQLLVFLKQAGALSPWTREMPNPAGSGFSFKVQLKTATVENWSNSAPAFFPKLLDFFSANEVKPLVPQQAFLIATAGSGPPDKAQDLPTGFSISLTKAMDEGLWISGDVLNFFWDDQNNTLSRHTFRQDGKDYAVALEIAGVGPTEPPENCWAEWNKLLPRTEEMTLDQARQIPGFRLYEPGYLPAGFQLRRITDMIGVTQGKDPASPDSPPVTSHFDDLSIEYSGQTGSQEFLTIGERICVPGVLPAGMVMPPTPDIPRETVTIHGAIANVNRYSIHPDWITPEPSTREYISLEWWENNYCFTITGSPSMDELTKIANSLR